ncbi:uncharacterized protein LOC143799229 [Ranitomeya variabilis]|uniref:uncharacterized protein LOC143799229 n=1 Tax=Ranitomeya variabilis TaxID=490064 RepID=UPI0040577193
MESQEQDPLPSEQQCQPLEKPHAANTQRRSSGSSRPGGRADQSSKAGKSSNRMDIASVERVPPQSSGKKRSSKSKHKECAECGIPLPDEYVKKLCGPCIQRLIAEETPDFATSLRQIVRQEIRSSSRSQSPSRGSKIIDPGSPSSREDSDLGDLKSEASHTSVSSSDTDYGHSCFSFDRIDRLVKAVNNTIGIEQTPPEKSMQDVMFKGLDRKSRRCFPVVEKVSALISREWKKTERKGSLPPSFKRKYPFEESASATWDKAPKLDAAVAKASKKSSLPFEDLGTLKDPLDRRADVFLKGAWETSAGALRPSIAATCTARSMMVWMDSLEDQLKNKTPRDEMLSSLSMIQGAAVYLADASADSVKLAARSAALSNSAQQLALETELQDLQQKGVLVETTSVI